MAQANWSESLSPSNHPLTIILHSAKYSCRLANYMQPFLHLNLTLSPMENKRDIFLPPKKNWTQYQQH